MYEAGDLIMYGATGVCRVDAVSTGVFDPDDDRKYYVLQPLYQTGTIYAPIDNNKVFIRPIISEDEANALIDSMPEIHSEVFKSSSIQQLSKHYQEVIDTHDCEGLVELTKSIHLKKEEAVKQNRHLGQIDRKFMKRAEDLLFGEIAAALQIPREEVLSYIRERTGLRIEETRE
ncbi:CarD family transcriptional regulator [Hornefia butyriciproducens]|uniref:CarD family transcriptional regulator n=1 Tax=Hornefia butyriciproducens TaxID=2652293 RepID=UPI0023EF690C|nr:CarD family transcriptional regulator [Hornefia butyriciproducens]MDD6299403.1 CarD family transcriptional regulator [Hornefia butyriciproducens]